MDEQIVAAPGPPGPAGPGGPVALVNPGGPAPIEDPAPDPEASPAPPFKKRNRLGKITLLNLALTFCILIFCFINYDSVWTYFWISLVLIVLFAFGVWLFVDYMLNSCRCRLPPWSVKNRTLNLEKRLKIGYGGCVVLGIMPQVMAMIFRGYPLVVLSICFVCNLSSFILISVFIADNIRKFDILEARDFGFPVFRSIFYVIHFILGAILIGSYFLTFGSEQFMFTFLVVAYYDILYPVYTVEYMRIWVFGIKLRPTNKFYKWKEEPFVPDPTMRNCRECHSCLTRYSDECIPRFLVACGHTLCDVCVEGHMNFEQTNVICPFCQKKTEVPGGVPEGLPKNLELVGFHRARTNGLIV